MADTIIYPLSEETGLEILRALKRIARALEGGGGATYEDGTLDIIGSNYDNGTLETTGTYDNGTLTF